mgnify:CR=1 FL=1
MAFYLSLALILTATWLNASQTYILSYRAQIKDAVVISESYHFSKAMQEIKAVKAQELTLHSPDETDLDRLMHTNREKIIDFMMYHALHTRSHEKVSNMKSSSLISITIPPTYITVDFNDDYAIITRLISD